MVLLFLIKLGLSKIFNHMASCRGCVPEPPLTQLAATEAVDETKILGFRDGGHIGVGEDAAICRNLGDEPLVEKRALVPVGKGL
jgi:hypothetical protein